MNTGTLERVVAKPALPAVLQAKHVRGYAHI